MGTIIARKTSGKTYYVYQESYRVKLDPLDLGKTKGSGKSAVRTRAIYLGTAEKILKAIQDRKDPVDVWTREFGLSAAGYRTAREIDLPGILRRHLPGDRSGVPIWIYFLVGVINRMAEALTLMRVMQHKARKAGYRMTPKLLKEELSDIREVVMVYDQKDARRQMSQRSAVQSRLWDAFGLAEMEQMLLHKYDRL